MTYQVYCSNHPIDGQIRLILIPQFPSRNDKLSIFSTQHGLNDDFGT